MDTNSKNGYFQLVSSQDGFGVKIIPPKNGGEKVGLREIMSYMDSLRLDYDLEALKSVVTCDEETTIFLGKGECKAVNENYSLKVSEDRLSAVARFWAPSENGKRMSLDEFIKDLRYKNIVYGIKMDVLQNHFQGGDDFCTDLTIAFGKPPRHGTDAQIEYFFNVDIQVQPTLLEDGSVDYFHLNTINHCKKGDILAKIVPADLGDAGTDVYGKPIKPRTVKQVALHHGRNILLSEDKLSIQSEVDGHVMLVGDKVFVSDVLEVENVDLSTGNIDFEGSVKVNGNVTNNMQIKANGNVIINGVVEGASIEAGGDIIIARGMNGMAKGMLKAGGNVIAQFLENSNVEAEGYVNSESIVHCHICAGADVDVTAKKGYITGGRIQAGKGLRVKNLGATMGATTVVEVGVNPKMKAMYSQLQREVMTIAQTIRNVQPVVANYMEKKARGARFSQEQIDYVKNAVKMLEEQKVELEKRNNLMKEISVQFVQQQSAEIVVQGTVYAGTNLVIGDASMFLQSNYQHCKFIKAAGNVKQVPL